jgi:hypothetical protein
MPGSAAVLAKSRLRGRAHGVLADGGIRSGGEC